MPDTKLSVGFNVPFNEAIAAMDAREIVLPAKYYGELQGIQRQLAFSIAGVASLDQLQAVLNSLTAKLAQGQSFEQWQNSVAVQDLGLPKHRLDNIYRTNIQNAYNRGHWEQFKQNEQYQPYLMYDAINDSRTRPSHRALDGIIRRIDDPFWDTHYPANGYRCRCSVVSLSESQAQARSKGDNGLNKKIDLDNMKPDKGWDYNCGSDITEGINKAIADRLAKAAAKTVEPKLAKSLKKKVVVPKDDPMHVDNIVAKTPADAPPKVKTTSKLASQTPQTNPAAKAWSKEHIDKVQKTFPYKFQDGVFNPDLVKTGGKIKNAKAGETWQWDEVKKEIVDGSHKKSKAALQKPSKASNVAQADPIAATWDDESRDLMREALPQNFDKNDNWVNPSKIKPTPSNSKVKKTFKKEGLLQDDTFSQSEVNALDVMQIDPEAKKWTKVKLKWTQENYPHKFVNGVYDSKISDPPNYETPYKKAQRELADKVKQGREQYAPRLERQREIMANVNDQFDLDHYWEDDNFLEGIEAAAKMGLTEDEHKAIYAYTGHTYEDLNGHLGGWQKAKTAKKSAMLHDFQEVLKTALNKAEKFTGTVRRDVDLPQSVIDNYVVGKTVKYEQFSSTTMSMDGKFSGNVIYTIETKNSGVDVSKLSKYRRENEVLINSGAKHRVINKRKVGDKWLIDLEEI